MFSCIQLTELSPNKLLFHFISYLNIICIVIQHFQNVTCVVAQRAQVTNLRYNVVQPNSIAL